MLTLAQIIEWLIVPLVVWNMYVTNKSDKRADLMERELEDLKGTHDRLVELENNQKAFYETIGRIRSDLHDIRNFLVRVITKDDPEKINDLVDTLWKDANEKF